VTSGLAPFDAGSKLFLVLVLFNADLAGLQFGDLGADVELWAGASGLLVLVGVVVNFEWVRAHNHLRLYHQWIDVWIFKVIVIAIRLNPFTRHFIYQLLGTGIMMVLIDEYHLGFSSILNSISNI
jgi:hypothetical protein